MGAPTLVSYTDISYTVGAGTRNTASAVSWQNGDLIVLLGGSEGPDSLVPSNDPVHMGVNWTIQKSNSVTGTCGTVLATALVTQTNSAVITVTNTNSVDDWGFSVWVFRNFSGSGVGNAAEQHTATKTVSITPAGGADSAFVWAIFDFAAAALQTIVPTPSNTRQRAVTSGHYTFYVADLTDQTSSGATAYGISGSGSGPFSIVALEIKGTPAAGDTATETLQFQYRG